LIVQHLPRAGEQQRCDTGGNGRVHSQPT